MRSIKVFALTFFILCIVTMAFANWGDSKWGGENFGAAKWGSGGVAISTYWNTAMTDRWTDTMVTDSLWTTTMNTEIP